MVYVTVIAPIKLNLNLHIIGVNHNNYHLLEGVTVFADAGDILHITINHKSNHDVLHIQGQFSHYLKQENIDDNLIMKAIKSLRKFQNIPFLTVTLEKNIPIQAGYGGGSSDAAAVLKGINTLLSLNLSLETLINIGKTLGADVPMCLYAKPCLIENIGDKITYLNPHHKIYGCLLLKPDYMLSTPTVFQALKHKNNPRMPKTNNYINYALTQGRNDLWLAAVSIRPELNAYLQALHDTHPIKAAMSGSGAGLFALYDTYQGLNKAYDKIKEKFIDSFVMQTSVHL